MITHVQIELPVIKPTEHPDAHQKTLENIAPSNDTEGGGKLVDGAAVLGGDGSQSGGLGSAKGKGKANVNGNGNGNANAKANGNGNMNANGNANANANANGNGNANANGNRNTNANANAKRQLNTETPWSRPLESITPPPSMGTSFIKVDPSCKFLVSSPMFCIQG